MKSIHFSQVPDMRGKRTMPWTDVTAFNAKEKLNEQFEMKQVSLFLADDDRWGDENYDYLMNPEWYFSDEHYDWLDWEKS